MAMALKSFSFVSRDILSSFHTFFRQLNAYEALPIRILISDLISPSLLMREPNYTKLSTSLRLEPPIVTLRVSCVLIFISSVFDVLIVSPILLPSETIVSAITCISSMSRASKHMSSAYSRSLSLFPPAHSIPHSIVSIFRRMKSRRMLKSKGTVHHPA